ncbi:HIT-like protein [Venturia nashicola]|nr:HIT-like protein [Venturia nashicola]
MAKRPDDALEREQLAGISHEDAIDQPPRKKPKNAFSELMSKKSPTSKPDAPSILTSKLRTMGTVVPGRDGLLAYIKNPQNFLPSSVITYDDNWVLIHDLYPKSSVHLLLLPRDPKFYNAHPYVACKDAAFLAAAKVEISKARGIIASELRRLYGKDSVSEHARREAMESEDPPEVLPEGRDWSKEIMAGVHANPSMNHLHFHILSKDRNSPSLKHRKHYNSFNTRFFVPVDDLPLDEDDERHGAGGFLSDDMTCWRCGQNFKNQFAKLKPHLDMEFQAWKKE